MKVKELIEYLESCEENAEVNIAFQPNYPLCTNSIRVGEAYYDEDDKYKVYMGACGRGEKYLDKEGREALNW